VERHGRQAVRIARAQGARLLELRALATQVLGALWLLPNCRILQLARYLDETFVFGVVVKDTPSAHPGASASPLFV